MRSFPQIYVVSDKLETVSEEVIINAESELAVRFPRGYREYMTELGTGMFCEYVYVYPPRRILEDASIYQATFQENYDLWSESHSLIRREDIGKLIVFAHTVDMGKIAFHKDNPETIFVLPYNHEVIYQAGTDLHDTLAWLYSFGVTDEETFQWFDSSINQRYLKMAGETTESLSDELREFVKDLHLTTIFKDFDNRKWMFIRELNGYMILDERPRAKKAQISVTHDKDQLTLINRIVNFFEQKDFKITSHGEKKK